MRVIVSYDITNDKRRRKVCKTLEGYGYRVQYSVFECDLNRKQIKELKDRLRPYVRGREMDSVRFYPFCYPTIDLVLPKIPYFCNRLLENFDSKANFG
ncbi:MAG: CRISPR-associated endonuclease Cas2 [Sphaerospermopsis sp. SIO1G2]|nr:CRISPR-associated endonuclease Cas2 [Sphaerospermopsis sp. SIO1G2]